MVIIVFIVFIVLIVPIVSIVLIVFFRISLHFTPLPHREGSGESPPPYHLNESVSSFISIMGEMRSYRML